MATAFFITELTRTFKQCYVWISIDKLAANQKHENENLTCAMSGGSWLAFS